MMIPFPFLIKAKYFIGILIVVTLAFAMSGGRKCGVCSPSGRIAVWLALHSARAEDGASKCGVRGTLLRDAQFVLPLEAAAGGEEI